MTEWPQEIVVSSPRGRIVVMDSMGYVDSRNDASDVLVCGSHSATVAVKLVAWLRPRGLIGHDAGIGKDRAGVSGLAYLQRRYIPGAAVDGRTARIGDGRNMYEEGRISAMNRAAAALGLREGMTTREAAALMLDKKPPAPAIRKVQTVLRAARNGKVIALDTIKYGDARLDNAVICMGSHSGGSMAKYIDDLGVRLLGSITNDAGFAKDRSAIAGFSPLDARRIPAAVVSCDTAHMGDAVSTYRDGVISAANRHAEAIGIRVGQTAVDAAELMLRHATKG